MTHSIWRTTLLAVLLVSTPLACARTPAVNPERAALEAAIQRWVAALNKGDVATVSAMMTQDVELADNVGTVRGRDAAIRSLQENAARGDLVATTKEITIANEVAWHVVGLAQRQQRGVVHGRGQALEIWKRVDGKWLLHRQMTAGVKQPEVSLTRPSTNDPVLDRPKN